MAAAKDRITRHYATIEDGRWGARQVHYRRVGSGPVVICLHQSPLSSRDMLPAMQRWASQFTCIAPDTPGFGLSDPLGVERAEAVDFAEAVVEFMDAIGVEKAAIYGFHTGAMIAGALGAAFPERASCIVANGYVLMNERTRADIVANYLPSFAPLADGSHLTWLWSRMREQTIFYPWYRKEQAARLDFDVPAPEVLHAGLLDFLRSGDHYRVGYRAAFTMRSDLALVDATVPTLVTAAKTDVLSRDLGRVRRKSASVTVTPGGTIEETLDLCADFIGRQKPPKAPAVAAPRPLVGRLRGDWVDVKGGQLRIKRNDDVTGARPIVVQHDAAGSTEIVEALASGFIGHRPVIAINLPGHGESDNTLPKNGAITVSAYAKVALQALDALGVREFDFLGTWGGGLVGLELALMQPARLKRLVMADLLYFDDALRARLKAHYTPDIQPNWYGGHLIEAWHLLRDQGIFWPWYERTRKGAIRGRPLHIDPVMVNRRLLDLFRSNGMWRKAYQAHFAYPLKQKLARCKVPMLFVSPPWDPQYEVTQQAARDFPQAAFRRMPEDPTKWGGELMPFLS